MRRVAVWIVDILALTIGAVIESRLFDVDEEIADE